jgi:hypothetical protein
LFFSPRGDEDGHLEALLGGSSEREGAVGNGKALEKAAVGGGRKEGSEAETSGRPFFEDGR